MTALPAPARIPVRLVEGDIAPDFSLPRSDGTVVALSAWRGRRTVLVLECADGRRRSSRLTGPARGVRVRPERTRVRLR